MNNKVRWISASNQLSRAIKPMSTWAQGSQQSIYVSQSTESHEKVELIAQQTRQFPYVPRGELRRWTATKKYNCVCFMSRAVESNARENNEKKCFAITMEFRLQNFLWDIFIAFVSLTRRWKRHENWQRCATRTRMAENFYATENYLLAARRHKK